MKRDTRIVHAGRHPEQQHGAVNPPIYHVSTITYPTIAAMRAAVVSSSNPREPIGTPALISTLIDRISETQRIFREATSRAVAKHAHQWRNRLH